MGVAKMTDFRYRLSSLINECSLENASDTPDFILAEFLHGCLNAFDDAINQREGWYKRKPRETLDYTSMKEDVNRENDNCGT